jgi:hypothetical protein
MTKIRRLVLDILKPHQPSIIEISQKLSELEGVEGVNSSLIEVDEEVKNIKVTIEGSFNEDSVRDVIEEEAGSIHSIDEVAVGERMVDKIKTPQD